MKNKYPEPYFSVSSRTGKTVSPTAEEWAKRLEELYDYFVTNAKTTGEDIDRITAANLHKYLD